MQLRSIEAKDKEYLWNIYVRSMQAHIENIWGWELAWQKQDFAKNLIKYSTCLITLNNKTIGYIQYTIDNKQAYINMLILDPSQQSQGIGVEVLKYLVNKNQLTNLSLRCFKVNKRAFKFYQKQGFVVIDEDENFYLLNKSMKQRLFIYGTLGPGRPNEHIMTDIGGTWQKASLKGILQQKGWGAAMGFPGIILDENGQEVQGYVFTSENFTKHWQKLDDFEGEAYQRLLTQVKLDDGRVVDAFVYALASKG